MVSQISTLLHPASDKLFAINFAAEIVSFLKLESALTDGIFNNAINSSINLSL